MEILVLGNESDLQECRQKFGDSHQYWSGYDELISAGVQEIDLTFNFLRSDGPDVELEELATTKPMFFDTSFTSLQQLKQSGIITARSLAFGFVGLRGFMNREMLEVSLLKGTDTGKLNEICNQLGTRYQVVADRIGMITPRVICMIINEAWFALADKTATKEDIDAAMVKGTNYPMGPFEWCEKIGAQNVVRLLNSVHRSTRDDRYIVCPMLKQHVEKIIR